jgi:hypothetical protein
MNWLAILAIALIFFWIGARVLGFVLGAAFNLIWVLAIVLLAVSLLRRR